MTKQEVRAWIEETGVIAAVRERSTEKVGEMIMRRLKELDKVAYVRFASVYLDFKDVSEFMSELRSLVRTGRSK